MNEVYVRWYGKVLQGSIVNEHDMFGMMAVSIPIQGVQAIALFRPSHVYKTVQDACGSYQVHFPTPAEIVHSEPSVRLTEVAVWPATLRPVPETSVAGSPGSDYAALQQFKAAHWDHAHNRLQLDYWPEFLRRWNDYHRKRLGMSVPEPSAPQQPEPQPQRKRYTVTELSLF